MNYQDRVARIGLAIALLGFDGCQQRPPVTAFANVGGKVTLDGTPLSTGTIRFIPLGGSGEVIASIKNGAYQLDGEQRLPAGRVRVEIRDPANRLPARYNVDSILLHDIVPGQQKLDMPLSSKQ